MIGSNYPKLRSMYEETLATDIKKPHVCKLCNNEDKHIMDNYALQPMIFNEKYFWFWYFLAAAYIGIAVAFGMINNPTQDSPSSIKLMIDWFIIDYTLIGVMTFYYFLQRHLFKVGENNTASVALRFNFFLERCSHEAKETAGTMRATIDDLVDEVWHSKKDHSALESDAYGMALQGLHKDAKESLDLQERDALSAFKGAFFVWCI